MRLRAVMGSVLALVLLVTVASGQGRQAGPPLDDDTFPPTMAMLQGTAMRKSERPDPEPVPILGSQEFSLGRQNIGEDQNRVQLLALIAPSS